jgi:CLIP-associating protein 1/2
MLPLSSPSRANEDITLMIPSMANLRAVQKPVVEPQRALSVPPEAAEELTTPVTESAPQLAPAAIIKAAPKAQPEDEVAPEPVVKPTPEHTDQHVEEIEPVESAEPVEPAGLAKSPEPDEPAVAVTEPAAEPAVEPADKPAAVPAESMHVDPVQQAPATTLQVYEDPFTDDQPAPKPTFNLPVLEDKPVNADAAPMPSARSQSPVTQDVEESSERTKQSSRLLESGITRIKAKTLDVHGFRKLQSLLRDSKGIFTDDKFEALLIGLFQYLEDPLPGINQEKAQDVKAQILATIRLLLRKERDNFQPHVSRGLESLLETRSAYDMRAHIVSGVEVLADELVTIGDGSEIVVVLTKRLQSVESSAPEGSRILSTGMHVLRTMLDKRPNFVPTDTELGQLAALAGRCLVSTDSGVRMDAVQLCVALHSRVGEQAFWNALKDVQDDPKSLITYYIVKRQREQAPTIVA